MKLTIVVLALAVISAHAKGPKNKVPVVVPALPFGECWAQADCSMNKNTICVGADPANSISGICRCKNACKVFGTAPKSANSPQFCSVDLCSEDAGLLCVVDSATSAHCELIPVPESPLPEEPSPVPSPIVEDSPAPIVEDSPAPIVEDSPAPIVEDSPAPIVEDSPAPIVEDSPAPIVEDSPAPIVEDSPAPIVEDSPAPIVEDSPAPIVEDSPAPIVEDSPAPIVEDSPAPIEEPLA